MKVWVAEIYESHGVNKFSLHFKREDAMAVGMGMMRDHYEPAGSMGDYEPAQFDTIEDYAGRLGLTKIIWVTEGFFPGAAEVSIYEKEIL